MQCSRPLHLAGPPNLNTRGPNPLQLRWRSEEHTSELQSQSNLVCRLLLEKKKKPTIPPSANPPQCRIPQSPLPPIRPGSPLHSSPLTALPCSPLLHSLPLSGDQR